MTGCHPDSEQQEPQLLKDLKKMVDDIGAIFSQLGQLSEIISKHWEMNYKADENLSRRLSQVDERLVIHAQKIERLNFNEEKLWHGAMEEINNRLEKLESYMQMEDRITAMDEGNRYMECLAGLELKLLDRINEFTKLMVKGDSNLENDIIDLQLRCDHLKRQINYNEKLPAPMEKISLEELKKQYPNVCMVESLVYPKMPHKCPICDGKTYCIKPNFQDGGEIKFDCKSCDKGIVWG